MALFDQIQRRASQYARYVRTERELRTMPLDVALDLNIDRGDSRRIARAAVYGA